MEYKSSADLLNDTGTSSVEEVDKASSDVSSSEIKEEKQVNTFTNFVNTGSNNYYVDNADTPHNSFSAYESVDVESKGGLSKSFLARRSLKGWIVFVIIVVLVIFVSRFVPGFTNNFFMIIVLFLMFGVAIPGFIITFFRMRASRLVERTFKKFPDYSYYNYFKDNSLNSNEYINNLPIIGGIEANLGGNVLDFVKPNDNSWDYVELVINVKFAKGRDEKLFKGGILSIYKDLSFLPDTFIYANNSRCGKALKRSDLKCLTNQPINIYYTSYNKEKNQALSSYLTQQKMSDLEQFMINNKIDIIIFTSNKVQLYFNNQNLFKTVRRDLTNVITNDLNYLNNIVYNAKNVF